MREIKFRGKRQDTGEWVYGDLLSPITGPRIVNYTEIDNGSVKRADYHYYDVYVDSVGQFTGLSDRNGKEVYEGDILEVYESPLFCEVVWDEGEWDIYCTFTHEYKKLFGKCDHVVVIGNIYDNPILINKQQ